MSHADGEAEKVYFKKERQMRCSVLVIVPAYHMYGRNLFKPVQDFLSVDVTAMKNGITPAQGGQHFFTQQSVCI